MEHASLVALSLGVPSMTLEALNLAPRAGNQAVPRDDLSSALWSSDSDGDASEQEDGDEGEMDERQQEEEEEEDDDGEEDDMGPEWDPYAMSQDSRASKRSGSATPAAATTTTTVTTATAKSVDEMLDALDMEEEEDEAPAAASMDADEPAQPPRKPTAREARKLFRDLSSQGHSQQEAEDAVLLSQTIAEGRLASHIARGYRKTRQRVALQPVVADLLRRGERDWLESRMESAIELFKKAHELQPDHPDPVHGLARCYEDVDINKAATAAFLAASLAETDVEKWRYARDMASKGALRQLEAYAATKMARMERSNPKLWRDAAELYDSVLRDVPAALKVLRLAHRRVPWDYDIVMHFGRLLRQQDQWKTTMHVIDKSLTVIVAGVLAGLLMEKKKEYSRARECIRETWAAFGVLGNTRHKELRYVEAICTARLGDSVTASPVLDQVLLEDVDEFYDLYYQAIGRDDLALLYFERLQEDDYIESCPDVYLYSARCHNTLHQHLDAMHCYELALEKQYGEQQVLKLELCELYRRLANDPSLRHLDLLEKANALAEELEEEEDPKEAWLTAQMHYRTGDIEKFKLQARRIMDRVVLPEEVRANKKLKDESRQSERRKLWRSFRDEQSADDIDQLMRRALKAMALSEKEREEAIHRLELLDDRYRNEKGFGKYRDRLKLLSIALHAVLPDWNVVLKHMNWALTEGAKDSLYLWRFYNSCLHQMNFTSQKRILGRLKGQHGNSAPWRLLSAHNYLLSRSYAHALENYQYVLKDRPNDPLILLCLGVTHLFMAFSRKNRVRMPYYVAQAFSWLLEYMNQRGGQHLQEALYNMARALQTIDLLHVAVPIYERALALPGPLAPEIAFNLSTIYRASGNFTRARELLQTHIVIV